MSVFRVGNAPCWVATVPPEGDELHFATRALAIAAAVQLPAGAVVLRMGVCCYLAECDRCQHREGDCESTGGYHLPAHTADQVLPGLSDLQMVGCELLCDDCRGVDPITQFAVPESLAALFEMEAGR